MVSARNNLMVAIYFVCSKMMEFLFVRLATFLLVVWVWL